MSHNDLLKLLLPPSSYDVTGPALSAELAAEGLALDRAQFSADQLLLELDPRTASLTLTDWERVYGLPDDCVAAASAVDGTTPSIAERRAALYALVNMRGGQSPAFFIGLAAALGYTITITEYTPHTTEDNSEHPVYDERYRFVWGVNAALYNLRELTTEDDTEMATAVWGNQLLECRIKRFKPAHTYVIFSYS